jgi:hypothetical protein
MLQETRLTMPVMTPDSALLFIFRLPLLNFGARYRNGLRCPPFESRDRRFVRRWLRFFHVRSVPNESAKFNVVTQLGKRIRRIQLVKRSGAKTLPHSMQHGNVTEMHEHKGQFKEPVTFFREMRTFVLD